MGDSVLGLLQFGWNALFKGHVLVGLYKGECFRSFQTLRLNVGHALVGLYVGDCFGSFQTLRLNVPLSDTKIHV